MSKITEIVTLYTYYSDKTTTVRATRHNDGYLYISHRAKISAEERLDMVSGDYIRNINSAGYTQAEGYVVNA